MNTPFPKLNLLDSKTIEDIKYFSITTPGHVAYVDEYWGNDDIKHAEEWLYEQFNYRINDYGFRGNLVIPKEIDIAAFGCSFTFGTGLAEHMLWHNLLAKELNMLSFNFGLPARSIESCVDSFLILSKHIRISNAIFLFPSLNRFQLAKENPDTKGEVYYLNTTPTFKSALNESFGINEDYLHRSMPEEETKNICKNQIYLLEHMAKLRNVIVYISSWDLLTYNFLCELDLSYVKLLPVWKSESLEYANNDLARDKCHPGPKHHLKWMSEIKENIKCTM